LHTDSTAAKGNVANLGMGRMKHIDIKHRFIKDWVRQKQIYVFKVLGTENWVDMLTKYLSALDLDKCMDKVDYFVRNDIGKKAVKEREVKMVVRNKSSLRSTHGALIAACMIGKARGEQITIAVDSDRDLIIALLVAIIIVLLTLLVSKMQWTRSPGPLDEQPETPPDGALDEQTETPPEGALDEQPEPPQDMNLCEEEEIRKCFVPSDDEVGQPEAREFQADMLRRMARGCALREDAELWRTQPTRTCQS
jgi:hypothetical protein